MLPSFGAPIGPLLLLLAADATFSVVCYVLFFTRFIDRPQLEVRRRAAIAEIGMMLGLTLAATLVPYEGEDGRRCEPALGAYGLRTEALVRSSADPCAATGQLLVTVGWIAVVLVALAVAVWWWSGDS